MHRTISPAPGVNTCCTASDMEKTPIVLLIAAALGCLAGCRTATVHSAQQALPSASEHTVPEMRGFWLSADSCGGEEEAVRVCLRQSMDEAVRQGCNVVFWRSSGAVQPGGYLAEAIETAHDHGLSFFLVLPLLQPAGSNAKLPFPEVKRSLRLETGGFVLNHPLDGLCFEIPGQWDEPFNYSGFISVDYDRDSTSGDITTWFERRVTDLIEDAAVGAMLVKPYMVLSVATAADRPAPIVSEWLRSGIMDVAIAGVHGSGAVQASARYLYPEEVRYGGRWKQTSHSQIAGLNLSGIFQGNAVGKQVTLLPGGRVKIADAEGFIGIIAQVPDTLRLETKSGIIPVPTRYWSTPYRYDVMADGSVSRRAPWVEIRRMPAEHSVDSTFALLCRAAYPAAVFIDGEAVKQYKTGVFFKDVALKSGPNRIRVSVTMPDGQNIFYEPELIRVSHSPRSPLPLWIDRNSVEPAMDLELQGDDAIRVRFRGSPGQEGRVELVPGGPAWSCSRIDFSDYALYDAEVPLNGLRTGQDYRMAYTLSAVSSNREIEPHSIVSDAVLRIRESGNFPLVRVTGEHARLTYNLGAPRLGGPIRSELGPGVVFKSDGIFGDNYRIRLSRSELGFIDQREVELLSGAAVAPSFRITGMSCGPSDGADVLAIPYPEPVPYEVHPDPHARRISIVLFGVETSSTWITHRAGLRVIDQITWEQSDPGTYRIHVNLNTDRIWGYGIRVEGGRLVFSVRHPPVFDPHGAKPMAGLKIALEAGHGGSNPGAIGLSGLLEKDINLDLSLRIGELCREMGAAVVQVREGDGDMTLIERRDKAVNSGADMLISIHANSAGGGYLRVSGTSTYYHNPFWAPLARTIYDRLLQLGLDEFGVVGSFNYTVTRLSQMPAVLVEQAFMSHAEDEEKLADPEFRRLMAVQIAEGIVDFLKKHVSEADRR